MYYSVSINGHCDEIPVRLERKRVPKRVINKTVLRTRIKEVNSLGPDDYYVVSLKYSENGQLTPYERLRGTKNNSWKIPFEILQRVGKDGQEIQWEVEVRYIPGNRIEYQVLTGRE